MKSKYSYIPPLTDIADYERLAINTRVPPHAHVLISTYFENWPCEETQAIYKAAGMHAYQYWFGELERIFGSCLEITEEFRSLPYLNYYINKYTGGDESGGAGPIVIKKMDRGDQTDIFRAFTTQLGMHWSIFPIGLDEVLNKLAG